VLTSLAAALTHWSDAIAQLSSQSHSFSAVIMAAALSPAARARLWPEDRDDRCGGGLRRPLSPIRRWRGHDPPARA